MAMKRQDVVEYRNIFLKLWEKYSKRFIIFNEDSTWNLSLNISPGDKSIVFITHDESTFNVNDGKCQY
jgi:hypothetical protein